jgi:6-pyruvoyltetrahydropterin/6-carboxytetrahydropterin synthase
MKALSDIIKEEILAPFDHRNLNLDVPEFQALNPTAENIAMIIWEKLRNRIDAKYDLKITLYETERNIVEYPAG